VLSGLVGLLLLMPSEATAQGFSIYEQGACTMGRAGATVADPCEDGSGIYFNPAGLTGRPGLTLSAGATAVLVGGDFKSDRTGETWDLQNDPIFVPHLYANYGLDDQLSIALGAYVPYGLGTEWPTGDFPGRFLGYDNSLEAIYVQPTLAYRITDRISIGAGPILAISTVELNQQLDLSTVEAAEGTTFGQLGIPLQTSFADANLEGHGLGFGGNIGIQVKATDWLDVGARFMTPITVDYDGTGSFSQVETGIELPPDNPLGAPAGFPLDAIIASQFAPDSTLDAQDISTEITLPMQIVAGVKVQATPQLQVLLDYQFTGWSSFDVIPLDFENDELDSEQIEDYENTNAVRLGVEYELNESLRLRAGYLFNEAAAPEATVTPLLPEADRNHLTAGLGWRIVPNVEVNVAYQYINQNDRRGRVRDAPEGEEPTAALNSGLYTFTGHLIGTTLTLDL
jgi:long-chain fatty acid transport protein